MKINKFKSWKNEIPKELLKNKTMQVINWTKYLKTGDNETLSSHNPTNAKGRQNKTEKLFNKIIPIEPTNTNPIPPAVGIFNSCELLAFGLEIKYFPKKGSISLSIQKVIAADIKITTIKIYLKAIYLIVPY